MTKPDPSQHSSFARLVAALVTLLMVMLVAGCASVAWAQSGRKAQKTSTPPATEAKPRGESESGQKPAAAKTDALVSFIVMQYDDATMYLDPLARDSVIDSFVHRLGQSNAVSVTNAGKGHRQEARARAKEQTVAYVVLFQLEEEAASSGNGSIGRVDARTLVLKTYVYTPKTADLKYTDIVYQRPYRQTARIGGIGIPVPTRRIERYPSQYELEQAARDAADRLLSRFQITPPPDN